MAKKKYSGLGGILKRMLFERDMKPADLAREVHIPPPTIHRLLTGKSTRPYKSSLQPIADFFSITIEQLLGEESLSNDQTTTQSIPLIPLESVRQIRHIDHRAHIEKIFVHKISPQGFATTLHDSSMEPIFSRGSILIFDPTIVPKDRSYVLVVLHESNMPVFRQLLIDLDHKYLKPLNPDLNAFKMRLLGDEDNIIAPLVEARQLYNES